MHRRQFLTLIGGLAGAAVLDRSGLSLLPPPALAQTIDRAAWWPPQPFNILQFPSVVLEWRYLAGRYTHNGQDFGFVCSLVDYKEIRNPLTNAIIRNGRQELIVMREDFGDDAGHSTRTYSGTLAYNGPTRTYSFTTPADAAVQATWSFDTTGKFYSVDVVSPELTLRELTLRPVGAFIPEGGDGYITSGNLGSTTVFSDYYADWLTIEQGDAEVGLARLDMQTIRPNNLPDGVGDFSHHWFALAGTLSDTTPVWITAWQIVSSNTTVWCVTIARHTGASWNVVSYTEEAPTEVEPLTVDILAWQPQPITNPQPDEPLRRTGKRWRLTAGQTVPRDLIDLTLEVPPGQFIQAARIASLRETPMQEAAGILATGSVGGAPIASVSFLLAESTYSELDPGPDPTPTGTPTTTPSATPTGTPTTTPSATPTGTPTTTPSTTPTGTPTTTPEPDQAPDIQIFLPLLSK